MSSDKQTTDTDIFVFSDSEVLSEKDIYVRTGEAQINIPESIEQLKDGVKRLEEKSDDLPDTSTDLTEVKNDIAEANQKIDVARSDIADNKTATDAHAANLEIHAATGGTAGQILTRGLSGGKRITTWSDKAVILPELFAHLGDTKLHIPVGGIDGMMVGRANGEIAWVMPKDGGGGGLAEITPEALFEAMMATIASYWEYHPINPFRHSPLEAVRVYSAVYGERFVMVGDGGRIAWSYVGNDWREADNMPFGDRNPIVGVCFGADVDYEALYLAIDDTYRYSFSKSTTSTTGLSTAGRTWLPAMEYSEDDGKVYSDYEFKCCCFGNQTFVIFAHNGRVIRATFSETSDPWRYDSQGNRVNIDWKSQESPDSITQGITCCCFGLNQFIGGGNLGKIVSSENGSQWYEWNTPFAGSNIHGMAFGGGKIVAVGADGKIAVSTNVRDWTLIEERPFGTNGIYSITYGGGMFICADVNGQVATSADGYHWKTWESPVQKTVRAICYGNSAIAIGSDGGEIAVSESLSGKFSNIDMGDLQEYIDNNNDWFANITNIFNGKLVEIDERLANKPDLGDDPGMPLSRATEGSDGSVRWVGKPGNNTLEAARVDHSHPTNLTLNPDTEKPVNLADNASIGASTHAARADHVHSHANLVLLSQVGVPNGITPLDHNGVIPLQYVPNGWDWEGLYYTLNSRNIAKWYIQPNPMFSDIASDAVIYAAASNTRTVVVVGERGRIAYGSHVKRLKTPDLNPFPDTLPVIGVACGLDDHAADIFIAIDSANHYSTSRDGATWTELRELDDCDIEGIMYGGGQFLIHTKDGYIYRSSWEDGELVWKKSTSSPLDTMGIHKIAFLNGIYCGVGVGGKVVTSVDGDGWVIETSPVTTDLMDIFIGNGLFLAVGLAGVILTSPDGKTWSQRASGRKEDFYSGVYYDGMHLVAGKNGMLIASQDLARGWTSPYTTDMSATIRVAGRHADVFFLGNDAGQIATCGTFAEILGMIFEVDTLSPGNDPPLPLAEIADPGVSNRYARQDHVHPQDGLVTKAMVGRPDGVASLDATKKVPDEQLAKGVPGGVAPLDEDNLVPKRHLPPTDVNVIIDGLKNNLEFVEVPSCFKRGPGVSSILHAGAAIQDVVVLVGEAGIGYTSNLMQWQLVPVQPFGENVVIGAASGIDDHGMPIFLAIDTTRSFSTTRDGASWTPAVTLQGDYDFSHISYYNRTFTIVCTNGPVLRSVWTADGVSFVEQADGPEFTRGMTRMCGGNGIWVGVGAGGKIWASNDASHFTPIVSPTTKNLYAIAHGKTFFLAGGEGGEMVMGDGTTFLSSAKPFTGNEDIMGLSYIDSLGCFIVTNRIGEIAVSFDLASGWSKITSTSNVAIRAITNGLDAIVLGNDLGEIAASRKVMNLPWLNGNNGGNAKLVRIIGYDSDGMGIGQLVDQQGDATGDVLRDIIVLQPGI